MLWAVQEWLEERRTDGLERPLHALNDAAAGIQGVSDALSVLSLTASEVKSMRAKGRIFKLQGHDIERISHALSYVSQVEMTEPIKGILPLESLLDVDTLKSILVCMALTLRREMGKQQALSATLKRISAGNDRTMCWFEINAATASPDGSAGGRGAEHPCAMALHHARGVLAAIDIAIEHQPACCVRLLWPEVTGT